MPAPHDRERSAAGLLGPRWWAPALDGAERATPPAWVGIVEHAVATAAAPEVLPPADSWPEAFAVPLRPFLTGVRDRVADGARRYLPAEQADPGSIADTVTAALERQLSRMAARTMATELEAARAGGRLEGADRGQLFTDFIRRLSAPSGLAALLRTYPVLARQLGTATGRAAEAGLELLARFAADHAAVIEALLDGVDPGPLVAIEPGPGDPRWRGRSHAVLSFADGRRVIYTPLSVQAHIRFSEVIGWLNERLPLANLRTAAAVARPGYGWLEVIAPHAPTGLSAAEAFCQRAGILLAALYAMDAAGIPCESLVASGDQPVLVGVGTLFHPLLPATPAAADDPAARALAASVQRALLPCFTAALHRSGAARGERANRLDPVLDGEAAVLAGFRRGYDAIAGDRQAFSRLLESGDDLEVRIVLRSASEYLRLLDESTDPAVLRDARDFGEALDAVEEASARPPLWRKLSRHELADLRDGDIPLLTGRPASRDVWTSSGQHLADVLDRPGLSLALDKVTAMGEIDRRDQEWIISASLAIRYPAPGHHGSAPAQGPVTAAAADPGRLLAAACGLADQLVALGMNGAGVAAPRVNWLGLQPVEDTRWMVLPMGASLADGYVGVALFLAQLASLTGIGRYAEVARRAVSPVRQLWLAPADRSDLISAVGCGGTDGLGGISYGLARMATLLDDAELGDWAGTAVELAAMAASRAVSPGWASGTAGCLAAMTAVHAELGSAAAGRASRECADHLAALVERTGGRCVPDGDPVPPGFAAGPAGIGWALARFAAAADEPGCPEPARRGYSLAGQRAVRYAGGAVTTTPEGGSHGWCRGTAGVLVARSCLSDGVDADGLAALRLLDGRPVLRDLSLCHGELGIAEALTVLAVTDQSGTTPRARRRRAGLILDVVGRHSRYCGTPGGIPTPGLLRGLAGIGYGLLRLGFAEQVPSVLLLEPTPQPARQHRSADPPADRLGQPEQGPQ